jgi:hypothetical protein
MKKLGAIVLMLGSLGLGACGGNDMVSSANKLKDHMCACTDQKCMDDVEKERHDMRDKFKGTDPKDVSKDTIKALSEAEHGYRKCRRDLRDKLAGGGGSGSATP